MPLLPSQVRIRRLPAVPGLFGASGAMSPRAPVVLQVEPAGTPVRTQEASQLGVESIDDVAKGIEAEAARRRHGRSSLRSGCSRRSTPGCRFRASQTAFRWRRRSSKPTWPDPARKHRISWMLVLPPVEPAKPKRKFAGQRAVRGRDVLLGDHRLPGAAAGGRAGRVGQAQQAVLRDLQLIEDRRGRTAGGRSTQRRSWCPRAPCNRPGWAA